MEIKLFNTSDLFIKAEPLPSGFWAVWVKSVPYEPATLFGAAYTREAAFQAVRDLFEYYDNRHCRRDPGYPADDAEAMCLADDYALM